DRRNIPRRNPLDRRLRPKQLLTGPAVRFSLISDEEPSAPATNDQKRYAQDRDSRAGSLHVARRSGGLHADGREPERINRAGQKKRFGETAPRLNCGPRLRVIPKTWRTSRPRSRRLVRGRTAARSRATHTARARLENSSDVSSEISCTAGRA